MKPAPRKICKIAAFSLLFIAIAVGAYHRFKPLPAGTDMDSGPMAAADVRFLKDITYIDANGIRRSRQEIFDETLSIIGKAKTFILLDVFLFNDFMGKGAFDMRPLSGELTEALMDKKRKSPDMEIILITDPINTVYGGMRSRHLSGLEEAGVKVVVTDLDRLRDSNPVYSSPWRAFIKPFENYLDMGSLNNPFGSGKVGLKSYLALFNFKANHRKVMVADDGKGGFIGMAGSANPHDGSSGHTNAALVFKGPAAMELIEAELAVAGFSSGYEIKIPKSNAAESITDNNLRISILTESAIKRAAIKSMKSAGQGDEIDIVMFYFSERGIIDELISAKKRGVKTRVLLDPNKDAFGYRKIGIPNRQTAMELNKSGIDIRWCDTHGEQCHTKLMLVKRKKGDADLLIGSANFTRRNIDNYNLELDALLSGPSDARAFKDASAYFDLSWNNSENMTISAAYETYADASRFKYWLYRIMEQTGMSTF